MNPLTAFSTRAKNRTESAAMNGGLEIALTILVFLLGGLALDNWLGVRPVFTIVMFLFAAIGSGLRYYYAYTADMERMDAEMRAARVARHSPSAALTAQAALDASDTGADEVVA